MVMCTVHRHPDSMADLATRQPRASLSLTGPSRAVPCAVPVLLRCSEREVLQPLLWLLMQTGFRVSVMSLPLPRLPGAPSALEGVFRPFCRSALGIFEAESTEAESESFDLGGIGKL